MNVPQSVPSGAMATLAWDTVSGKSESWPDVTAPVTEIPIPSSGIWEVWIRDVDFGDWGAEGGMRGVYTRRNGDAFSTRATDIRTDTGVAPYPTAITTPGLFYFETGETVAIRVRHSAGIPLQIAAVEVWLWLKEPGVFEFVGVN